MARILLVMFNAPVAQRVVGELKADGHKVDHVVGILQLSSALLDSRSEPGIRAISSDQSSEAYLKPSSYDLAIVCTSSGHIGNYAPGEIASWLHANRVAAIAIYGEGEELEMRLANVMFGIQRSDKLVSQLIYGDRSVARALATAGEIVWADVPASSELASSSIFCQLRYSR